MRFTHLSLHAVCLWVAASSCYAQQVRLPDGTAPDGSFVTDSFGDPIAAWCTFDGYQPLTEPKLGAPSVDGKRLTFLQPATVVRTHKIQRGEAVNEWHLLGALNAQKSGIADYYGWVKGEHCLVKRECLTTSNGIFRKAMIVNAYELDEATKQRIREGGSGSAPVLLAPSSTARKGAGEYLWFSFFFVYGESDDYVLLGSSPTFSSGSVSQVIKGWVHRDSLCRWDTREAYHWDRESTFSAAKPRRTTPAMAYRSPDQAWQMLRQARLKKIFPPFPPADPPDAENPIHVGSFMFEQFDKQNESRELAPYEPRFPNLGYEGSVNFPSKDRLTDMRLLRIGCIGGVGKFSPAEVEKMRRELNDMLVKTSTLEIVFLIDDTLSMEKWFRVVSATVEQIHSDVVKEFATGIVIEGDDGVRRQIGQARIAVSYYNDLQAAGPNKGQHICEINELRNIDREGESIARALASHQPTKDLVANNRELLFDGIAKAVRGANFTGEARRILILLGDFGDVHATRDSHAGGIARFLGAFSASPIEFYPIQVVDSRRVKHSDYDAFVEQMEGAVDEINRKANEYLRKAAQKRTADEGDGVADGAEIEQVVKARLFRVDNSAAQTPAAQVSQFVLARYRDQKLQVVDKQAEIRRLIHGDWHTKISAETLEQLRDRNFPVDDLVGKRGIQMFQEGYVWEGSGLAKDNGAAVPQVRLWALMNRREVELLKNTLFAITSEGRASPEALAAAVAQQIDALTGDTTAASTPQDNGNGRRLATELSKKIPGLDSLLHSPLLTEALNNANFGELHASQLVEIHRCALRLDDILKLRRVERREDPAPNSVLPNFIEVSSTTLDRTYRIPDSPAVWYWIDVEKELP